MKKILALVLALVMVLMVGAAFAQSVDSGKGGTATITVRNAAKGETYSVVKVFDATVTGTAGGSIAYTGTIPEALASFFEADSEGNISVKRITDANGVNPGEEGYVDTRYTMTADDFKTMGTWAKTQTPEASAVSDGSALTFTGLKYGYYVVLTTQGEGIVTVDSTNPNAAVNDKNTTTIKVYKESDKDSYSIGDTITYTATFDTTNFYGSGDDAKVVTKYDIEDTLPEFLSDVKITSVKVVKGTEETDLTDDYKTDGFGDDKMITIIWADKDTETGKWTSRYTNGSQIVVTYTTVLTSVTNINTADTNTVSIHPHVGDNDEKPWDENWQKDKEIKTYAAALHKVDENDADLKGAQFTIKGLTVTGSAGVYTVSSYNSANDAEESAVLDTDDNGYLYILGLADDVSLTVTEYKAPDGYNKLTAPVTVTPQLLSTAIYKESGTIKYDAKGNVIASSSTASSTVTVEKNLSDLNAKAVKIENKKGTELPSTGGIGTTIFYVLGGLLVIGAAVILVARRKAHD